MKSAKKRRISHERKSTEPEVSPTCILHFKDIDHGAFIPFSNTKCCPNETLAKLIRIRDKRLCQPYDSITRMQYVCNNIPESLDGLNLAHTGYHRACYQKFTKNQDRLQCEDNNQPSTSTHRSPRKLPPSDIIFPPTCIFCGKLEIKHKGKTERCTKFAAFKGKEPTWLLIEPRALEIGESRLHRMVVGEDLFAREACFHKSCHDAFHLKYLHHQKRETKPAQDERSAAYQSAFDSVLDLIEDKVIRKNEVVQLTTLHQLYIKALEQQGFSNPDYPSIKLKLRLQRHEINERIEFTKVTIKGCIAHNLIFSKQISLADAVASAYRIGSRDNLSDVALDLRNTVKTVFNESKPLPWPPTADELESLSINEYIPSNLMKFLTILLTGDTAVEDGEKAERIIYSLAQVITSYYDYYMSPLT
jgi:hypothetical protein